MGTRLRFYDKSFFLTLFPQLLNIRFQPEFVRGKEKSERIEAVIFKIFLLHALDTFGEVVFAGEGVHTWKMVDFLVL